MSDLRTRYQIDLEGNLERQARRFGRSIDRMSANSERSLGRMRRGFSAVGNVAERSLNRYSGLVTGAAGFAVGRFMVGFERRLTRLGIAADLSDEKVESLRKQIFDTAQSTDIAIPVEQLLGAVEEIVEKTGNLKFAEENLRNLGLAIQASGAEGSSIGGVFAELEKLGETDSSNILTIMDTLVKQGKDAAFTLDNLAALGPRVVTAYSSVVQGARSPVEQMRELGAALQVIREASGSPEQAATTFEATIRNLTDPRKLKFLRSGGIQVFDQEALKKGTEQLRPINEILVEIQKATNNRRTLLGQVFEAESIKAFAALTPESMDQYFNAVGHGETLLKDSARAAADLAGALDRLNNAWKGAASSSLADVVGSVADAINSIDADTLDKLIKWGVVGAAGFGAMGVLHKGIKWGGTIAGAGKKAIGKGGAAGAISGMTGVTPVYVVNMPGAKGMPGMGGGAGKGAGRTPKVRRPGRFGLLKRAPVGSIGALGAGAIGTAGLAVGASGAAGYGVGSVINDQLIDGTALGDRIGRRVTEMMALFGNDEAQRALDTMDRAAEKMERAADKIERSETKITLGYDGPVRVPLRRVESRGRDVDLSAGPLRAGMD